MGFVFRTSTGACGVLRRVLFVSIAVGLVTALIQPSALASSKKKFTFENKTGQNVNDLHLEFGQAVDVVDEGAFQTVNNNETGSPSLEDVDENDGDTPDAPDALEPGDTVKIKLKSSANKITLQSWFWTLDGQRVGNINQGCNEEDGCKPGRRKKKK